MPVNQKVDELGSVRLSDLNLVVHVAVVGVPFGLRLDHVLLNIQAELRNVVHVVERLAIVFRHQTEDLVFTSVMEHLKLLAQSDLR